MSKETYIHVKRDLQMKICIHVKFAETYKYLQQGLNIYIHKETYIHVIVLVGGAYIYVDIGHVCQG